MEFNKNKKDPYRGWEGVPMWPGPSELILILIIVVMLFGAKRIPEIMGGLGKGIKTFKKAMEGEDTEEVKSSTSETLDKTKEEKAKSEGGDSKKA